MPGSRWGRVCVCVCVCLYVCVRKSACGRAYVFMAWMLALFTVSDQFSLSSFLDLAQRMLQVPGVRYDPQHEDLQGLQQATILRGVSFAATVCLIVGKGRGGKKVPYCRALILMLLFVAFGKERT